MTEYPRLRMMLAALLFAACAKQPLIKKDAPGWSLVRGIFETNGFFRDVAVGDVNNDGYLDVIGGNSKVGGINVWLSSAEGSRLDLSMLIRKNLLVDTIEIGDVNSDGWNDIVASPSGRGIEVLLNGRDGTWYSAGMLAQGGSYSTLRMTDLNGDGAVDLVGCNFQYRDQIAGIQVWLNTGKGKFDTDTGPRSEGQCRDVIVTDFDGDNKPDIVAAFWGPTSSVRIWRGDGRGGWWAYPMSPQMKQGIWSVGVADVDKDGLKDLLVALYPNRGVSVIRNKGEDGWEKPKPIFKRGNFWKIWVGDLNGNGQLDLVGASHTGAGMQWWQQDGSWQIQDVGLPIRGDYYGFRVGDLNGDGTPEIVAASYGEGIRLWSTGNAGKLFGSAKTGILPVGTTPLELDSTSETGNYRRAPLETTIVIYFDHSQIALSAQAKSALEYVVAFIKKHPGATVELVGHAEPDAQLPPAIENLEKLSRIRAESVGDYLSELGVNKSLITFSALGETAPLSPVPEANRAVEVVIKLPEAELPQSASQAAAGTEIPPPPRFVEERPYVIGPGDVLAITLWQRGKPEAYVVNVRSDGTISFLFLRDVMIAGNSVKDAIAALENELKRYYKEPLVDVVVKEFNSQRVLVIGAIGGTTAAAGSRVVPLSKPTRIVEVIAAAGGPNIDADLKNVSIANPQGQTQYINMFRVLFEGDQSQNIYVSPGEVVFVPSLQQSVNRIYVFGEVLQPGAFPLRDGATILDVIADAGGYSLQAKISGVGILRPGLERPEILTVNLERLVKKGDSTQNIPIQNRDIIYVPRHAIYTINQWVAAYTQLAGSVLLPLNLVTQINALQKQ
ncbi:MAG: VCBS repeat-containing protein [Nitrospirae bacterium]|nr:VCBS repeat-containing protein [Nitrospirota bacterium]